VEPWLFLAAILATSIVAGAIGAILGLGGGIVLVPILTMFYGINLRDAMGASIISVIATSSGAAAAYLRTGLSNMRIGLFLAMATVSEAHRQRVDSGLGGDLHVELAKGHQRRVRQGQPEDQLEDGLGYETDETGADDRAARSELSMVVERAHRRRPDLDAGRDEASTLRPSAVGFISEEPTCIRVTTLYC